MASGTRAALKRYSGQGPYAGAQPGIGRPNMNRKQKWVQRVGGRKNANQILKG